jgi:4-amino-4-deoxy-L-arabinose transferase-like glycosyltransferase
MLGYGTRDGGFQPYCLLSLRPKNSQSERPFTTINLPAQKFCAGYAPGFKLPPVNTSIGEEANDSICFPESDSTERRITLLLFLLTSAYLLVFRRYTTMDPDEGITLQGAQRILQGEVLYRDFFSFFTPGSYYLLSLLFKLFGNSFLTARTALVLFGGLFSVVTYLLARRVSQRSAALIVAGLVSFTCLPYRFMVLHNWDSTFFACLAVYTYVRMIESRSTLWAFAAGTFASLTFLFEQSKGGGLILGLGVGLVAVWFSCHGSRAWFTRAGLAALTLGAAWPVLITLGWFYAKQSIQPMILAWVWPLQHYSLANRVPYGYQNWVNSSGQPFFGESIPDLLISVVTVSPLVILPFLPLLAVGMLAYFIVQIRRRRIAEGKGVYYVLINSALFGLLLSVVIGRPDILHFMYLQPLFCIVLAWIFDGRDIPGELFAKVKPIVTTYIVFAFFVMSAALLVRALHASPMQTHRGEIRVGGEDNIIDYIRANVAPGETILIHPYFPLYHYLTGTFNPGRYEYLQPGLHTPEQFQEMLTTLSTTQVRSVLFELSFPQKIPTSWPNTPLGPILRDPVSDYILEHYRTCRVLQSPQTWRFLFMLRKDLPCPAGGLK